LSPNQQPSRRRNLAPPSVGALLEQALGRSGRVVDPHPLHLPRSTDRMEDAEVRVRLIPHLQLVPLAAPFEPGAAIRDEREKAAIVAVLGLVDVPMLDWRHTTVAASSGGGSKYPGMSYTLMLPCGCTVYVSCDPITTIAHTRIIERHGAACAVRAHRVGARIFLWEILPERKERELGEVPDRPRRAASR